jgi:hypothetical protein
VPTPFHHTWPVRTRYLGWKLFHSPEMLYPAGNRCGQEFSKYNLGDADPQVGNMNPGLSIRFICSIAIKRIETRYQSPQLRDRNFCCKKAPIIWAPSCFLNRNSMHQLHLLLSSVVGPDGNQTIKLYRSIVAENRFELTLQY